MCTTSRLGEANHPFFALATFNVQNENPMYRIKADEMLMPTHFFCVVFGREQPTTTCVERTQCTEWRTSQAHTRPRNASQIQECQRNIYIYFGRSNSDALQLHHHNGHENKSKQCDVYADEESDNNN